MAVDAGALDRLGERPVVGSPCSHHWTGSWPTGRGSRSSSATTTNEMYQPAARRRWAKPIRSGDTFVGQLVAAVDHEIASPATRLGLEVCA